MTSNGQQPQNQQQPKKPQQRALQLAEVKQILLKLRETREGSVFDAYDALIVDMFGRLQRSERQIAELIKAVRLLVEGEDVEEVEAPAEGPRDIKSQPFPEGVSPAPSAAAAPENVDETEGEEEPAPTQNTSRVTNVAPIPPKA